MNNKRKVEVFSAGCPVCDDAILLVQQLTCSSCEVEVLEMSDPNVSRRARELNVRSLPAVVVDGKLAGCRTGRGLTEEALRSEGIGQPIA